MQDDTTRSTAHGPSYARMLEDVAPEHAPWLARRICAQLDAQHPQVRWHVHSPDGGPGFVTSMPLRPVR